MRGLRQGICVVSVGVAVGATVLATAVAWEDSSIAKVASVALTAVVLVVAGGLGIITTEPADLSLAGRLAKANHFKEAAAEYAKYLELAPSGSLAQRATERLKMAQEAAAKDKGAPKKK